MLERQSIQLEAIDALRPTAMPEQAEDLIVRNLIEALERLREDLDRLELWAAVLDSFRHPIAEYRPADQHLLKPQARHP